MQVNHASPEKRQHAAALAVAALFRAIAAFKAFDRELRGCGDLDTLDCLIATDDAKALIEQCKDEAEPLWLTGEGLPPEFEPLSSLINRLRNQLQAETEFAVKGGEYVAAG